MKNITFLFFHNLGIFIFPLQRQKYVMTNMFGQQCATRHPQANPMLFFPLAFTGKYFCAFLHEFSFRATLHQLNFENKVKTITEAKASQESEETRWMICIHLVPSSYEICKGFPCF